MKYAEAIRKAKHDYLSELLKQHAGNVTKAARVAGVNRTSLYKLAKLYGVHDLIVAQQNKWAKRGQWDREIPSHW